MSGDLTSTGGGVGGPSVGAIDSSMKPLLDISDLRIEFPGQRGRPVVKAVDSASLTVRSGETVGLVGESGSGKTTLALAVLGLVPITSGAIHFDGHDLTSASHRTRRAISRDLQVVFQDPYSSLNPTRTIAETLSEPLTAQDSRPNKDEQRAQITRMLELVGLPPTAAERYPAAFSGGQRQRIAIARALIVSPKLVICDEAVSALDLSIQAQILNLLADLRRELDVAYLFISHDLAVVRYLATHVTVLYRGQIMETGPAESVCTKPSHPYTKALLAAAPSPDPASARNGPAPDVLPRVPHAVSPVGGCPYQPRCPLAVDICKSDRPRLRATGTGTRSACHLVPEVSSNGHTKT